MLIKVKVFPGSKKGKLIRKSKDSFEIKVREKPIRGEANRVVVSVLSDFFKVPKDKIRLIKGFRQRNKIFEVTETH